MPEVNPNPPTLKVITWLEKVFFLSFCAFFESRHQDLIDALIFSKKEKRVL